MTKAEKAVVRAEKMWADASCEQVYSQKKWPKWAQGNVVVVKASDFARLARRSKRRNAR